MYRIKERKQTVKKAIASLLFLAAAFSGSSKAEANTVPNELLGTWSVSQSGTDILHLYEMSSGAKTIWILKPDSNGFLTIEAYGVSMTGIVFPKTFPVASISYDDGRMIVVSRTNDASGLMTTTYSFTIDWTFGPKGPSGSGRYNAVSSMAMAEELYCSLGACGLSSSMDAGSGAISLSKQSDSRVPPQSKPQPPPPPASSYIGSAPPMQYMMPSPNYGSPPRSFDYSSPRNNSGCMMNRHMCTNGCDPPSYGMAKDYNRINSCRADCEQIYSRCMGQ